MQNWRKTFKFAEFRGKLGCALRSSRTIVVVVEQDIITTSDQISQRIIVGFAMWKLPDGSPKEFNRYNSDENNDWYDSDKLRILENPFETSEWMDKYREFFRKHTIDTVKQSAQHSSKACELEQIHVDATGDGSWKQKLLGWGNAVADLNNTRAQCWTVEEDIETFKSAGFKVAREYQVDDYAGNSTRHFRGALMNYVPVNLLRLVFNQPGALARVVGTSGGQQPSVLLANADNPLPPLTTRLRYATIADRRRLFVTETMAFRRNTDFNSVQSNMLENLQNLLEPENIYLVAEIEAEDITPRDGLKPPVVNGKMIVGYLKLKLGEKTERVEQITN